MKGLNKAYLIGHIGQDPEVRTTATGKQLVKLSLATSNNRKVNDAWVDTPDWHRLTMFDKTAEFIGTHARKGDVLAVECTIRPNKWTDKENVVHYEVSLLVDRVLWLNGKHRGVGTQEGPSTTSSAPAMPPQDVEEEVPF